MTTTTSVLELDDVLRRHAWVLLKKKSNFLRRWLLEENDFVCEVDWKALTLDHNVSKFDIRPDNKSFKTDWGSIKTGASWTPLYACDFENRSENKQSHTFRGSRETTTWIAVDLSQAYTTSEGLDVDVTFPTRFGHFRAGRDNGFKVTKIKGNVFKEVLNWEVNSQVEVMPSWKAHAQLLARQESHVIDFEVRTTLALPNGVLPVFFKRRSDKSIAFEVRVDSLEDALQSTEQGGVLTESEEPLVHRLMETVIDEQGQSQSSSRLQLLTRGTCVCVAWSDQKVEVRTAPLSVSQEGDDGDVVTVAEEESDQQRSQYLVRV